MYLVTWHEGVTTATAYLVARCTGEAVDKALHTWPWLADRNGVTVRPVR